jgi:hypothetical protein
MHKIKKKYYPCSNIHCMGKDLTNYKGWIIYINVNHPTFFYFRTKLGMCYQITFLLSWHGYGCTTHHLPGVNRKSTAATHIAKSMCGAPILTSDIDAVSAEVSARRCLLPIHALAKASRSAPFFSSLSNSLYKYITDLKYILLRQIALFMLLHTIFI